MNDSKEHFQKMKKAVVPLLGSLCLLMGSFIFVILSKGPSETKPKVGESESIQKGYWDGVRDFFNNILTGVAGNALATIATASASILLGAYLLIRTYFFKGLQVKALTAQSPLPQPELNNITESSSILNVKLLPKLEFALIEKQLSSGKKGDKFIVQKNWLCPSDDKLHPGFAKALFDAIRNGVDVYIFLLHPRSPSARRRAFQLDFDKKSTVSDRVITSVRRLQEHYKDRKKASTEGKLKVFCHDTYSGFELFLHDTNEGSAWAQLAFYNCLGLSSDYVQFVTSSPELLAQTATDHAWKYLRLFGGSDGIRDYAVDVNLEDTDVTKKLLSSPLMVEAEDIAFGLTSVSKGIIDSFATDISTLAKSSENPAPKDSVPYHTVLRKLGEKAIITDATATELGVRSVVPCLNAHVVENMVKETPDGGQFVILDNWLVGDLGVDELKPSLINAFERRIEVTVILLHPNSVLVDRRLSQVPKMRSVRKLIKSSINELFCIKSEWENEFNKKAFLKVHLHDVHTGVQVFMGASLTCVGFYLKDKLASKGPQMILETASEFGMILKNHILAIANDKMRCVELVKIEQLESEIDGKLTPGQLAEISELICNISLSSAEEASNIIANHARLGPTGSGLDTFKLNVPDRNCDYDNRQKRIRHFADLLAQRLRRDSLQPSLVVDFATIVNSISQMNQKEFKEKLLKGAKVKPEAIRAFQEFLRKVV